MRWLLWLLVLLLVPALAAWAFSQPGPWRRLDAAMITPPQSARTIPAALSAAASAGVVEPGERPGEPSPSPPRDMRTAPERLAAAWAVPRNPRCALLIRTAQLGTPMEVTDLAYLTRACAPD